MPAAGLRLTSTEERQRIRELVERRTADLAREDLVVLGYAEWLDGLERGVAAHHAGMLPTFKETVEELFVARPGAVRVRDRDPRAGHQHAGAQRRAREAGEVERGHPRRGHAGEYTQLTGRAGRRGIDVEGSAVVVWHQGFDPGALAGLASTRTYPLRSSFRPSYNMAVNLVG